MTVVHLAGTATTEALPKVRRAFDSLKPLLEKFPALEGAEYLVNHAERKVQFLLYFSGLEESQAFFKQHRDEVLQPFRGLVSDVIGPFFFAVEGEVRGEAKGGGAA